MCCCEVQWIAFGRDIEFGESHEEEAAKCSSKEGTVDRLKTTVRGSIDVQARGAEELNSFLAWYVIAANGKDAGLIAEDAWAGSEVLVLIFVCHLLYTGPRRYVTLVNETVEQFCAAFYLGDVVGGFHMPAFSTSPVGHTIAILISHLNVIIFVVLLLFVVVVILFFLLVFFWFHV